MATEQETFDSLRRAEIDRVDHAVMDAFDMPLPYSAYMRDTYAIEIETEGDFAMLLLILEHFHWSLDAYIKHSVIEWTITEPLAPTPELPQP